MGLLRKIIDLYYEWFGRNDTFLYDKVEFDKHNTGTIEPHTCSGDCKGECSGDCNGECSGDCKGECKCEKESTEHKPSDKCKTKRVVYHVVPGPNGWLVKKEKNKNPSAKAEKKTEAVAKAKELAKKAKLGQVIVHKKDGKIQTEYTYGEDPRTSKG